MEEGVLEYHHQRASLKRQFILVTSSFGKNFQQNRIRTFKNSTKIHDRLRRMNSDKNLAITILVNKKMANKMQVGNPLRMEEGAFLSIPIRAALKAAVNFGRITIWEKHPTESNKDL
ncbi:hypothetical protein CEXT_591331 [Caerostris extrusa]|uniref:Uncharacterized protein n=1 Tax=Caerostris extrusa TaxID=172846 RepID=A0AAV4UAP1_CAEEX|nr:hypothetical protein CEXT_591331 [Caerostris extrusa]